MCGPPLVGVVKIHLIQSKGEEIKGESNWKSESHEGKKHNIIKGRCRLSGARSKLGNIPKYTQIIFLGINLA